MQFHQLSPKTKFRKQRRIGRGGKRGTFSGRGIKGQRARAGAKIRPALRDILKKIPKLRGYKFRSYRTKPVAVGFDKIAKKFKTGDTISPDSLLRTGLVSKVKGRMQGIKILGNIDPAKKFIFKDVLFSAGAHKKPSGKADV